MQARPAVVCLPISHRRWTVSPHHQHLVAEADDVGRRKRVALPAHAQHAATVHLQLRDAAIVGSNLHIPRRAQKRTGLIDDAELAQVTQIRQPLPCTCRRPLCHRTTGHGDGIAAEAVHLVERDERVLVVRYDAQLGDVGWPRIE